MLLREAREVVLNTGACGFRLAIGGLQQLAVACGELLVVLVARLVEEPQHLGRAHVLDLLDTDERGLAAVALDLLREPLKVLIPIRRVGEHVGGSLERHGAERAQPTPHAHAQTRRRRRHSNQQEEKLLQTHC